jgi:hypothetical protein
MSHVVYLIRCLTVGVFTALTGCLSVGAHAVLADGQQPLPRRHERGHERDLHQPRALPTAALPHDGAQPAQVHTHSQCQATAHMSSCSLPTLLTCYISLSFSLSRISPVLSAASCLCDCVPMRRLLAPYTRIICTRQTNYRKRCASSRRTLFASSYSAATEISLIG